MYAYIDETGNTGANLFDPEQPWFITGALLGPEDIDVDPPQALRNRCLHAAEMTLSEIEEVLPEVLNLFVAFNVKFSISAACKADHAAIKFANVLLDPWENRAVSKAVYLLRPLRSLTVLNLASLLDEAVLAPFWKDMVTPTKKPSFDTFKAVLSELSQRVQHLGDQRAREVIGDAVQWALKNPEAFNFHSADRQLVQGHYPNMACFHGLLHGMDAESQLQKRPVSLIKHDRQMELKKCLEEWHRVFSHANKDPLVLPGGESHVLRVVEGSQFRICDKRDSLGIQLIDLLLWLIKRVREGKQIPANAHTVLDYAGKNGTFREISLDGMRAELGEILGAIAANGLTEQQIQAGVELMRLNEEDRQKGLRSYKK